MGSSCPLLSSPAGNDPAFPKLALLARSHAGGLGASFGSAITESLLPEKAIHLSRKTVPPGSNCYQLRHGKGWLIWKPLNLQRTEICRLLSMPVRKTFLCWLRELVSAQAIFKTLRGDRACKALRWAMLPQPSGCVQQGLGKALSNKIPMGQNERNAKSDTSVESCSKKLPLSLAALFCGYTGLLHQYSDCDGVFCPLFTTTTAKRVRFVKCSGIFLFSLSAPYNDPAVRFAKDF